MFVFIWERLRRLTTAYHTGGGLVVVAANLGEARRLAAQEWGVIRNGHFLKEEPDLVLPVAGPAEPKVFVFRDTGCCSH